MASFGVSAKMFIRILTQNTDNVPMIPAEHARANAFVHPLRHLVAANNATTTHAHAAIVVNDLGLLTRSSNSLAVHCAEVFGSLLEIATIPTPRTMRPVDIQPFHFIRSRMPQMHPKCVKIPLNIMPNPPSGDMSERGAYNIANGDSATSLNRFNKRPVTSRGRL